MKQTRCMACLSIPSTFLCRKSVSELCVYHKRCGWCDNKIEENTSSMVDIKTVHGIAETFTFCNPNCHYALKNTMYEYSSSINISSKDEDSQCEWDDQVLKLNSAVAEEKDREYN